MSDYREQACKGCKHWADAGPDPNNLGAPHNGQCRVQLYVGVLPTNRGPLLVGGFPGLPGNHPACSRFEQA